MQRIIRCFHPPVIDRVKGYIYAASAAVIAALSPILSFVLLGEGMDVISILFYGYTLGLPVSWGLLRYYRRQVGIGTDRILPICGIGLLSFGSAAAVLLSFSRMNPGVAVTTFYVYPLIISVIMATLYNRRLNTVAFYCIIAALIGVWMITSAFGGANMTLGGIGLVLLGAALHAATLAFSNSMLLLTVSSLSSSFWITLTGAFASGLGIALQGHATVPSSATAWLCVAVIALLPVPMSYCNRQAVDRVGYFATASMGFLEALTMLAVSALAFGYSLNFRELIGVAIVLGSSTAAIATRNVARGVIKMRSMLPAVKNRRPGSQY